MMAEIPLIPALALALVSFLSSIFIILRIVIPILPPHPLSRRVSPKEFGLPNFRSLSALDKSHIWLATCDVVSVAFLVSQVMVEYVNGSADFSGAEQDPGSAARLWLALTFKQTTLLIISAIVILHVRMGMSVSFGVRHWMVWAPLLLFLCTSVAITVIVSRVGIPSLFMGITGYTVVAAATSTMVFGWLVATLKMIRRNLTEAKVSTDPWPATREKSRRGSFATEEVDGMKDRDSWITSIASTHARTLSAFSFSTAHSAHHSVYSEVLPQSAAGSHTSLKGKSSFWFSNSASKESQVPPVPPLPSPYRTTFPPSISNPVPEEQGQEPPTNCHPQLRSQDSWLTESSNPRTVLSSWSFPSTRPPTPADNMTNQLLENQSVTNLGDLAHDLGSAEVLGGYGHAPSAVGLSNAEKGVARSSALDEEINIPLTHILLWLSIIWVPLGFSLPYLCKANTMVAAIFLILSVTISSPLLAVNILTRSSLPIGPEIFVACGRLQSRSVTPASLAGTKYKRSGSSQTAVESRRSGDVWVSNGDAVDHRTKIARALGLLPSAPKLSVLPQPESEDKIESSIPGQEEFSYLASMASRQSEKREERVDLNEFGMASLSSRNRMSHDGFTTATSVQHKGHLRSRSTPSVYTSMDTEVLDRDLSTSPPTSPFNPTDSSTPSAQGSKGVERKRDSAFSTQGQEPSDLIPQCRTSTRGHQHYSSLPMGEDTYTLGAGHHVEAGLSRPSLHLDAVAEEDETQAANSPYRFQGQPTILVNGRPPVPPSAASTVTAFDVDQGENLLYDIIQQQLDDAVYLPPQNTSRSSLVYTAPKDDFIFNPLPTQSLRTSKGKSSKSRKVAVDADAKEEVQPRGLRPLRLLQDKNMNADVESSSKKVFRTLSFGKKRPAREDENSPVQNEGYMRAKGKKQLKLASRDTSNVW